MGPGMKHHEIRWSHFLSTYRAASILSRMALVNSCVVAWPPISRVLVLLPRQMSEQLFKIIKGRGSGVLLSSPFTDHIVNGLGNAVSVLVQTEVAKKHRSGQDHGGRVGLVLALDIKSDVATARLKNSDVSAHVTTGNDAGATNESSTDVGKNTSVEVRHDHHVELLRPRDSLHRRIVHNHVVRLYGRVVLSNLMEGAAEKTVGKLHDICLVDAGHLLPVVRQGKTEGKFANTLRLGTGNDLQRLHNTLHGLVLETGVLSLGILTDNAEIDIIVSRLVSRDVLNQYDRGVDVEFLAQGNVE